MRLAFKNGLFDGQARLILAQARRSVKRRHLCFFPKGIKPLPSPDIS
jgi:hypothetical protein